MKNTIPKWVRDTMPPKPHKDARTTAQIRADYAAMGAPLSAVSIRRICSENVAKGKWQAGWATIDKKYRRVYWPADSL